MKVAVVGPGEAFRSGISAYMQRYADAFARGGHEAWYLPIRKLLPRFLFPADRGAQGADGGTPWAAMYRLGPHLDYSDPFTIRAAKAFVREERPELLVLPWWTSAAAHMTLPLAGAARRAGVHTLLEVHEVRDPLEERHAALRAYSTWALRRMVRRVDSVVAHADSLGRRLADEFGATEAQLRVWPHPAYDQYGPALPKAEARRRIGVPAEGFVVLFFGLVRDYKGVPDLVRALDHLPPRLRKQARLLVVGSVWDQGQELARAVQASPLRERIRIEPRYVPDVEVKAYFSAADVVALPYHRAAQSGVLHIAKAFRVPVVVSAVGGLPEAVAAYPSSALCRPGDARSIARALERVAGERRRRGAAAPYHWGHAVRDAHALVGAAARARPAAVRPEPPPAAALRPAAGR